jgi:hypothetical protein
MSIDERRRANEQARISRHHAEQLPAFAQNLHDTQSFGLLGRAVDGVANFTDRSFFYGLVSTRGFSQWLKGALQSQLAGAQSDGLLTRVDRAIDAGWSWLVRTALVSTGWLTQGAELNQSLVTTSVSTNGADAGVATLPREPLHGQITPQITALISSHRAFANESPEQKAAMHEELLRAVGDGIQNGTLGSRALGSELRARFTEDEAGQRQALHNRVAESVHTSVMTAMVRRFGRDLNADEAKQAEEIASQVSGVRLQMVNGSPRYQGVEGAQAGGMRAWLEARGRGDSPFQLAGLPATPANGPTPPAAASQTQGAPAAGQAAAQRRDTAPATISPASTPQRDAQAASAAAQGVDDEVKKIRDKITPMPVQPASAEADGQSPAIVPASATGKAQVRVPAP